MNAHSRFAMRGFGRCSASGRFSCMPCGDVLGLARMVSAGQRAGDRRRTSCGPAPNSIGLALTWRRARVDERQIGVDACADVPLRTARSSRRMLRSAYRGRGLPPAGGRASHATGLPRPSRDLPLRARDERHRRARVGQHQAAARPIPRSGASDKRDLPVQRSHGLLLRKIRLLRLVSIAPVVPQPTCCNQWRAGHSPLNWGYQRWWD